MFIKFEWKHQTYICNVQVHVPISGIQVKAQFGLWQTDQTDTVYPSFYLIGLFRLYFSQLSVWSLAN